MKKAKKAALYVRVSTADQTVDNQVAELERVAEFRGWEIVTRYSDLGISGAKGRQERPGLDTMLKDASEATFDVVMAWSLDRLGRSLVWAGRAQSLPGTANTSPAAAASYAAA